MDERLAVAVAAELLVVAADQAVAELLAVAMVAELLAVVVVAELLAVAVVAELLAVGWSAPSCWRFGRAAEVVTARSASSNSSPRRRLRQSSDGAGPDHVMITRSPSTATATCSKEPRGSFTNPLAANSTSVGATNCAPSSRPSVGRPASGTPAIGRVWLGNARVSSSLPSPSFMSPMSDETTPLTIGVEPRNSITGLRSCSFR